MVDMQRMNQDSSRPLIRRIATFGVAAVVGIALGVSLTGLVQKQNQQATRRWQTASVAHDALIEIATLEAVRAELVSANQFDRDNLLQLWRQHQARVDDLLKNTDLRELDRSAVANADRWFSLYSSSAERQVSASQFDPEQAARVASDEVVPNFLRLQEAMTDLRLGLDKLGPNAQRRVNRELWIVLPALATLATLVAAGTLAARRRAAVHAAEARRDARYRAIVQGATDVLTVVDAHGRFAELSASAEAVSASSNLRNWVDRISRWALVPVHPAITGASAQRHLLYPLAGTR